MRSPLKKQLLTTSHSILREMYLVSLLTYTWLFVILKVNSVPWILLA